MDISFYCFECGQHLVVDAAGAGQAVNCPKCQAALVVPSAQDEQSSLQQDERPPSPPRKPKRLLGLMLGIVGLVFLAILFTKTHPKPADQMQAVVKRFDALSSASADVDSLAFDVMPSPSGSLVSPHVSTVDYVVPAQVGFPTMPASDQTYKDCHVHIRALFAYQNAEWVFKELQPDQEDVDRAGWKYTQTRRDPQLHGRYTFILSPESLERLEQHRKRWQAATAR